MIEKIREFAKRFGSNINLDHRSVLKAQGGYFLLNENLRKVVLGHFFWAGIYLGRDRDGGFLPSFNLLRMIAESESNKIVVDSKTAWLFVCGRDVFMNGIREVVGSNSEGDLTLVLNQQRECLGFGRIACDLAAERKGVAVVNLLDIGDFLRREK